FSYYATQDRLHTRRCHNILVVDVPDARHRHRVLVPHRWSRLAAIPRGGSRHPCRILRRLLPHALKPVQLAKDRFAVRQRARLAAMIGLAILIIAFCIIWDADRDTALKEAKRLQKKQGVDLRAIRAEAKDVSHPSLN